MGEKSSRPHFIDQNRVAVGKIVFALRSNRACVGMIIKKPIAPSEQALSGGLAEQSDFKPHRSERQQTSPTLKPVQRNREPGAFPRF
jgi:hypothetical protein